MSVYIDVIYVHNYYKCVYKGTENLYFFKYEGKLYEFRPKLEILSVLLPRFLRIVILTMCATFFIYLYNLFALNTRSVKFSQRLG
jgi:sensor histidine kinase YesM